LEVTLRDINEGNWFECITMHSLEEDQNCVFETWIASNALSLAQAKIFPTWITKGIYAKEKLVGFTMYGKEPIKGYDEICRLMIDYQHQGKGYGRKAMELIIETMKEELNCEEIHISFHPENKRASKLYKSLGFTDTGLKNGFEVVYSLKI